MKQTILLILIALTAAFSAHADYRDFEVDGIYYFIYGNNVTVVDRAPGQGKYSGDIVIPETVTYEGVTYTVTTINYRAFDDCTSLTSVSIPKSVTSIGSLAFARCSALTSLTVDSANPKYDSRDNCNGIIETSSNKLIAGCNNTIIPDSVISIGSEAFFGSGITSILIPKSVTSIGEEAFSSCDNLININVDSENPKFDSRDNCNAIIETSRNKLLVGCMNTTIPNTITYIDRYAFWGCHNLTSITIPDAVTYIGENAFGCCFGLTNVIIGNSVSTIGNSAFAGCTSLTTVSIPNSVKNIGKYAFASCNNLSCVTLPNSITSVGSCAFEACSSLSSVTLPNHITSISAYMFRGCTSLSSITIPDYPSSICEGAFQECESLKSVTIPNSVISIGKYAFYYCSGLSDVTIGNSVIDIDDSAFGGCSSLKNILIPSSVTTIGMGVLMGCRELMSIEVESGNPNYDSRNNCNAIIETSSSSLLAGCKNTSIPNSVTTICRCAFTYCDGLTDITIPNSVTLIESEAFFECQDIRYVTCLAVTPPDATCMIVSYDHMYDEDYKSIYELATLFVPNESLEAYYSHWEWGSFSHIVPFVGVGPGDINADGEINIADVTGFIDVLMSDSERPAYYDVNGDGEVNIADVTGLIDMLLSSN